MSESQFRLRSLGFTLIELLVVIGILILLASLVSLGFQSARQSAYKVQCLSKIRSIGQVSIIYANDDIALAFPFTSPFSQANLYRLLYDPVNFNDDNVLICPIPKGRLGGSLPSFNSGTLTNTGNISYHFVRASATASQTLTYPASNVLLIEKNGGSPGSGDFHAERGVPVFRINGTVEMIDLAKTPNNYAANGTTTVAITSNMST